MRDLLIIINEKYQRNRAVIWFIVAVIVLFLLVTRQMDKYYKSAGGSGSNTATSGSVYNSTNTSSVITNVVKQTNDDYNEINEKLTDIRLTRQDKIDLFVQLCNSKKFDTAYEYISDDCKDVLYPTKQEFINSYGNVIFKTSKLYEVTSFKNNTYKVKYMDDSIATGRKSSTNGGIIDYITVDDNGKINISNFVSRKQLSVTSIAPYFTVYVKEVQTFVDYELYSIEVRNNTSADIYMNDVDNSLLYLENDKGNIFYIDSSYMFDNVYYVTAGDLKEIKLKFNLNYTDGNKISQLCFGNVKVVNKEYYDTLSETTKKTTFQEKTSCIVKFYN